MNLSELEAPSSLAAQEPHSTVRSASEANYKTKERMAGYETDRLQGEYSGL